MSAVKFLYIDGEIVKWDQENKHFHMDGDGVPFSTQYRLINRDTKESRLFSFILSTGSEWDADTMWCYASSDGYKLFLTNGSQENITMRMELYANSKGIFKK
jgi:hypothetical protein